MDLFARQPPKPSARPRFEAGAGWRFGFVFGVVLIAIGWGLDAWLLATTSTAFFWGKLPLALITILPLAIAAGWLAARASILLKFLVWMGWGVVVGWLTIHLPFEATSALAALADPTVRGLAVFPFTGAAQERIFGTMLFGVVLAIPLTVIEIAALGWAWDQSDTDDRMTRASWSRLVVGAPFALALAILYDSSANAPFRAPVQLTQRVIETGLRTPSGLKTDALETHKALEYIAAEQWRGQFAENYTQQLADFEPEKFKEVYVDVVFADGFIWRCPTLAYGEYLGNCQDLRALYRDWMQQFLSEGAVRCQECAVEIAPDAAVWQRQNRRAVEANRIAVEHHAGGVVVVRAEEVECYFVGAQPVVIQRCARR